MMRYYPIFLDLRRRRCAVVGGGAVAERKVRALLRGRLHVTIEDIDLKTASPKPDLSAVTNLVLKNVTINGEALTEP